MSHDTELTEADYDALHAVVGEQMPRVTRSMFPAILAQLVDSGVLEMTLTDKSVTVRMSHVPTLGEYRVERKWQLH